MITAVFGALVMWGSCSVSMGQVSPFLPRPGVFPTLPVNTPFVPILDYSNEINVDGSYRYSFATADGKQAEESGYLKDVAVDNNGDPVGVQVVQGSYSYTSPDGTPVHVTYIADENGFHPTSVRIPSVDGRVAGVGVGSTPIIPRVPLPVTPFASPYRSPYSPLVSRYSAPIINAIKPNI